MEYRLATYNDISGVLDLQAKYHINTILEIDKADGFVTTKFTRKDLEKLILDESGLHIAIDNSKVVAYVMAASWQYWSNWPFFVHMINGLNKLKYLNKILDTHNSYQYGPICIDKSVRGQGVLEGIFEFSRSQMKKKYPILVTFINKTNPRSYEAHVRKLELKIIHEFEYSNNQYYELVYDTKKQVKI